MRLITWNCSSAFRSKHDKVMPLAPDLLIVPECEDVSLIGFANSQRATSKQWIGDIPSKGLGVFAFGDYSFTVHPLFNPRHKYFLPLLVSGPSRFSLLAAWSMPHPASSLYAHSLLDAFEEYKDILTGDAVFLAGDLNANYVFDRQNKLYTFRRFVDLLRELGLRSLVHEQNGFAHGEEDQDTFFMNRNPAKGHHLDYIFAGRSVQPGSFRIDVGSHENWSMDSDHVPIVYEGP